MATAGTGRAAATPAAGWNRRRAGRPARPAPLEPASRSRRLLERETHLAAARAAIGEARDGHGHALAFTGGWGMGRTKLLAAIARDAAAGGARVLSARGGRDARGFRHGVALQLMEALYSADPSARPRSPFAGAGAAERFLAAPEDWLAAERDEALLNHSIIRVFVNLAAQRPLAIVVDDSQWADESSLRLLAALVARVAELRIVVFTAARQPSPQASGSAYRELLAGARRHSLEPLGRDSARQVIERFVGACSAELAGACHRETGGVPALVVDAARVLKVRSWGVKRDGGLDPRDLSAALVSPELQDRLEAELGRLPEASRSVARAAAVLGAGARAHRIAKLCELPLERVAIAETALEDAGFFDPARPFRFGQPLLAEAVRAQTPPAEADRMHAGGAWRASITGCVYKVASRTSHFATRTCPSSTSSATPSPTTSRRSRSMTRRRATRFPMSC